MFHQERVIALVDMDCFYCQVEEKLDPSLCGKPMAVVQYNQWKGGGIIAVNYSARDRGVTRHMRGDEAKEKCPEIALVRVPQVRGKADLTKYREAGKSVAKVLQAFTELLERASVDEAYLDLTGSVTERLKVYADKRIEVGEVPNTHVVGCEVNDFFYNRYGEYQDEGDKKLAVGAVIVEEIRAAVYNQTGFRCSAGIAHNKILAKLASGLHKPNKQTILPHSGVNDLFKTLPIHKIRSLGGKFGNSLSEELGINYMAELAQFTENHLATKFDEKTAKFLYNIARGIDFEPVTTRLVSKSIGCCKKFAGRSALIKLEEVQHWVGELAEEISERLEQDFQENNRKGKQIIVSFANRTGVKVVSGSKTQPLNSYDAERIGKEVLEVLKKNCMKSNGSFCITYLGLSVGKFEDCKNVKEITDYFKVGNCNRNVEETIGKSRNSGESEPTDCGLFSDSTVDLNESDNGVFYDEVISKNGKSSDEDSMEEELQQGFFVQCLKDRNESESTRNFDTSRCLMLDSEEEEEEGEENAEASTIEMCTECGEAIPLERVQEHTDYHFALNLRKAETTSMHATSPPKRPSKPNMQKKKHDKRKNTKLAKKSNLTPLTQFFQNTVTDDSLNENTETCPECKRKVDIDSLPSHLDYHVARKLHMEINSMQRISSDKNKISKQNSVKTYFKSIAENS